MKTKRVIWTIIFLGITLAAIVMEVVAGIFHPAGTIPWTEYLARYVPWPVQLTAYVILAVWLPFHFWRHDHLRKVSYRNGQVDATLGLKVEHAQALEDAYDRGYLKALKDHNVPIPQGIDLLPAVSVRRGGITYGPQCSHGFIFGFPESHHCGELPGDAPPPSERLLLPRENL